jgi:CBS domain-containing protein
MKSLDASSAIAGEIMTPYVIMLKTDATFQDVINSLHKNKITGVFIHDEGKDEYFIISQTDIISYLEKGGMFNTKLSDIPVSEIMHGPIDMLDFETAIDNIIRFMTKRKYKRVLISKEGKAVGVVSTRDIMMWNNTYFKQAKPQILLFMDNITSNFIGRHIFEKNVDEDEIQRELIDLYGGALSTLSIMTDEIMKKSGKLSQLMKEKRTILFQPYLNITGILISDYNSIELRHKLRKVTNKFCEEFANVIDKAAQERCGIHVTFDIGPLISIFKEKEQ